MRKSTPVIDYSELEFGFRDDDYEIEQMMHDTIQNLQNAKKWLYLGADISNPEWVKIGITAGDLRSRSYSSANPNYYIFCAFQFDYKVTIEEMRKVEMEIHYKFDQDFRQMYGHSRRLPHYESRRLSECYWPDLVRVLISSSPPVALVPSLSVAPLSTSLATPLSTLRTSA